MNSFNHNQTTASAEWVIAHGLGSYPVSDVVILEGGKRLKVLPLAVEYIDADTLVVRFSGPRTGSVRLLANDIGAAIAPGPAPSPEPVEPVLVQEPHWEAVSSLVHFDGDGTAEKGNNVTVSAYASISSDQAKFGTTSLYVTGNSNSYASLPDSEAATFGTGDYTVEMFIFPQQEGMGLYQGLFYRRSGTNFVLALADGKLSFWNGNNINGNWAYITAPIVPINEWSHIAYARENGIVRIFLNGVRVGMFSDGINYVANNSPTYIGSDGPSGYNQPFKGYIDELRLTTGVARYVDNFVPPTSSFAQYE